MEVNPKPEKEENIFEDISATNEPIIMESFCVNCQKNGKTTILLTSIPFFKEIIIVSFACEECGYRNNEVQSGGKLNEKGVNIRLKLTKIEDLSRDVVKSEFATIKIPEIDLEVPSSKKGALNTIEGFLNNFYDELLQDQEERRKHEPVVSQKIDDFLEKLKNTINGDLLPFTFIIEDPSGNSYIRNPHAPKLDPELTQEFYERTTQQLKDMGFDIENSIVNNEEKKIEETKESPEKEKKLVQLDAHRVDFTKPLTEDVKGESISIPTQCHSCCAQSETKMCTTSIPYFKELIVMSFTCDNCGARSTEVKTGGETSKTGRKIVLHVENEDDIRRDCFKSETCKLTIPEVELELIHGTLGGRYTTIEGLLEEIVTSLKKNNPFVGDSIDAEFRGHINSFFHKLHDLKHLKSKFTIIFEDPLDNSFIQNPYYPDKDPRVESHVYERTFQENEELGLNDMKTENY